MLAHRTAADMEVDKSYDKIKNLATTFGINTKIDSAGAISKAAYEMHTRAALYASMRIVELVEDYAKYKISVEGYLKQYFIGHYNPRGNFFHAWAIKNKLVEMLDPKPTSYKK